MKMKIVFPKMIITTKSESWQYVKIVAIWFFCTVSLSAIPRPKVHPQRTIGHLLGDLLVLLEGLDGGGELRLLLQQLGPQPFRGDGRDVVRSHRRQIGRLSCGKEKTTILDL